MPTTATRGRHHRAGAALLLAAAALTSPLFAQVWEVGNQVRELGVAQAGATYGAALAIGDFDGDGRADLVVGAPSFDGTLGGQTWTNAGRYDVYRGKADRQLDYLTASFILAQDVRFGSALAAGDFDGDGHDDLAFSQPGFDLQSGGTQADAGLVSVRLYEGPGFGPDIALSQDTTGGASTPEPGDQFGWSLAAGDFDDDGYDDLAVGVPFENWGGAVDAGVVHVFYGGPTGIDPANGVDTFGAGMNGVQGAHGDGDLFAFALAAGDFDQDGITDLAIGAPLRTVGGHPDAGQVHVLYGSPSGVTGAGDQLFADADLGGVTESGDRFGSALAVGYFDDPIFCFSPCAADLAIGAPSETLGAEAGAGKVTVAYGSASGLSGADVTLLRQDDVPGQTSKAGDNFGFALAAGRMDAHSASDLAVGAPGEGGLLPDIGVVHLFFGAGAGINAGRPPQTVPQRAGFGLFPPAAGDRWGARLAIGDFDDDGWGDLVVGVLQKDRNGQADSGAVQILYGALFADGFERGSDSAWGPGGV
ncbi:MAG TPA: FG-GAP repeat protein [Thermoanaerobaculia bacterium]|nr:FG-GAP repeat protein [Thermoanaerobaculia bacterium]